MRTDNDDTRYRPTSLRDNKASPKKRCEDSPTLAKTILESSKRETVERKDVKRAVENVKQHCTYRIPNMDRRTLGHLV